MASELSFAAWSHVSGSQWQRFTRIDTWSAPSFEERFLEPGPWSMSLPLNSETAPIGRTSLISLDFRSGRYTGRIDHAEPGSGSDGRPVLLLSGVDAMAFLSSSSAWPVPSTPAVPGDVTQSTSEYYAQSGAAETVLSGLILANNINRDHMGFALAPDQGRGANISIHARFGNVLDIVTAWCRTAGLGVRVGLVAADPSDTIADLTCSFFQPRDQSADFRISTAAGTLRSWSQANDAPTATRALVAGQGTGANRVLRLVIDTAAEAASGRQVEVFVDARDVPLTDPNMAATLDQRGLQAIADAAGQSSATIEATDAPGMLYDGGDLIQVGDLLSMGLIPGLDPTVERLEAATITQQAGAGVQVTLTPGNADGSDPAFQLGALLKKLRRDVNTLQREA